MKTMNLFLTIAFLGLASLIYANADQDQLWIRIPLKKAIQNPKLVRAMYEQLDMSFINVDQKRVFVTKVRFNRSIYFIYGTYEEWLVFFTMDLTERRETRNPLCLLSGKSD